MIQRIQTIYLILVALLMGSFLKLPLFRYGQGEAMEAFRTTDCTLLVATIVVIIATSLGTVFLYNKRPLQIKLGYILVLLHLVAYFFIGAHYYLLTQGELPAQPGDNVQITFWIGIPLLSIIFALLAIRGIRKDEKLVRSLDRLR